MFGFFEKKSTGNTKTLVLSLSGLHCTSCAVNIDLTLEDLLGVADSKTNYARSRATIDFEPDKIDPEKIIAEVSKLGYSAKIVD
ncbi:hypothetical protein A3A84_03140 [Candidatus Collierbacteria bacterium RIFCSPLOWO2_01_FULL_50_23]|uniref:HMA domain-containing protein n=2 Tax=Candidatus Collieribacteriota TaxID=1752725 RepID=A0A1F5EXA4_9BACT|nr:MAG: hypothetical protein A3D09_03190 [Candidatus Collierbacteria bacterium RIFCSPHIGHO2_02_FULL_49_10]OGD71924.1 MAG: hypothetical protein A2703_00890 [Candidatus Collierbacteria bacterium RIFCSPHIGHO2_01_FULL_50_25]OGD74789.1 MAG: hypothetical protein A3A84_03140 [Candidatus Collierbacteria bacterium RIFCSPLOWO2_01_FULL_50_23]